MVVSKDNQKWQQIDGAVVIGKWYSFELSHYAMDFIEIHLGPNGISLSIPI